ncbi:enolase C-terminal domain-like protein [Pontibacter sp. SGAir0037]|uniref:enolase C-terminal domain-like protein n=1 Tax=Pontibacter sp. SGAir0037 TaxID=2571030 RepID=UPI0010CD5E90|nr:enolase C-terminal domain-like protein [Pontibacter sp. SGAir0037]QCR23238.1 dipeptide epimerase [Pontibacter sp. SGAir0037]
MLNWRIEVLHLKLKYTWKISREASKEKTNFLIQVSDAKYSGFGEAAPNIRYGESPELLLQQYQVLLMAGLPLVKSMEELMQLLLEHPPVNSLRFAIESAYLHFYCQHSHIAVHQMLGQASSGYQTTSFSLPIMQPGEIKPFIEEHDLSRFKSLKIKVNSDNGLAAVEQVLQLTEQPLVIDANESWQNPEDLLRFLHQLDRERILFVEQPMPATHASAYAHLKKESPIPLVADESVTDDADFDLLREQFHGVNIKLMKAGGYLNAIRLLKEARKHNMMTMMGCMVETSLGIWSAMQLSNACHFADLDGFLIIEQEPFGLVKEKDGLLYLK